MSSYASSARVSFFVLAFGLLVAYHVHVSAYSLPGLTSKTKCLPSGWTDYSLQVKSFQIPEVNLICWQGALFCRKVWTLHMHPVASLQQRSISTNMLYKCTNSQTCSQSRAQHDPKPSIFWTSDIVSTSTGAGLATWPVESPVPVGPGGKEEVLGLWYVCAIRKLRKKHAYKPYRWKYTRTFSGPDSVLICLDGSHWWWWWRWHQQVWFENLLIEDRLESESQRTHEAHRIQPIQLVLVPPVLLLSSEQTV